MKQLIVMVSVAAMAMVGLPASSDHSERSGTTLQVATQSSDVAFQRGPGSGGGKPGGGGAGPRPGVKPPDGVRPPDGQPPPGGPGTRRPPDGKQRPSGGRPGPLFVETALAFLGGAYH